MNKTKKILRIIILLLTLCGNFLMMPLQVNADQIKSADVFSGTAWNPLTEWTLEGKREVLQSMCITDKYLVCYHDMKKAGKPDTLYILDRNTYEVLFEVSNTDYEHGNGMTYNANTNEVIIAPYTCKVKKNKGTLFILDADSFELKRQVQVSDGSWDPSAVEYLDNTDQYIIQSNSVDGFVYYLYDSEFNYVDTLFAGDTSLNGNRFQDFCVSGDYLISIPYMFVKEDSYLQLYSISQRTYLGAYQLTLPDIDRFEAESIAINEKGEIVLSVVVSGTRRMALYNTYVPIVYTVDTYAENGEITPSSADVDMGSDYKVQYNCTEDYELKQLQVDGQDVELEKHKKAYTFGNIQSDHSIFARFTEIPKFDITTGVTNGVIDDTQLIRRDEDVTIHYEPDLHYEVDKVLVDGSPVDGEKYAQAYTFEFIQGPHSIQVDYKEIPSFVIATKVENGTITATNKKVYRDENYTIHYNPDENYSLAHMKVDGQWMMEIGENSTDRSYTFENIQKGHNVEVLYRWKYLPFAILAGAFAACVPMGLIYLGISRIRNQRKSKRTKNEKI